MRFNKLNQEQENRIISICKLMLEQNIHEMTCICDDNLDYSIGAYKEYFEIRVKRQVKEGIAWIDYCDFYTVDYTDFTLEYISSSNDLS